MKVGSVIKLTRPCESDELYRDELGVVVKINNDDFNDSICYVRFESKRTPPEHYVNGFYTHRLDEVL